MALTNSVRFIILWTIVVVVTYFVVPRTRIQWVSNSQALPMTQPKFDSLMLQLPENLRSSAETVGASYQLFNDARIRFLHFDSDSSDPANPLPECIQIILDQKLCLFFYPDSTKEGYWEFDGYEAGDYENPGTGEYRWEIIDRDPR